MPILQADQIMDYEVSLWGQVIKGNQDQVQVRRIYRLPNFTEIRRRLCPDLAF